MIFTYTNRTFSPQTLSVVETANGIIEEYKAQGYTLTLRQLYYQFVARDRLPNDQKSYKRLGSIVNDGRLAGLIDWAAIEDRTRNLKNLSHWSSPKSIINAAAHSYRLDKWADQPAYVEVWIEKDALAGVVERACNWLDVPWLSTRGYISQSEMHGAALRFREKIEDGKQCVVIHLSDHDPSGIDMTRDARDRFRTFLAPFFTDDEDPEVYRLALTMEQVDEFDPPPNPAKITDSRANAYIDEFGEESWELDAIDPPTLTQLIQNKIRDYLDDAEFTAVLQREKLEAKDLRKAADRWPDVAAFLKDGGKQ